MINMSHCRFENTDGALEECINAIERGTKTSETEAYYAQKLYESACNYIEVYKKYGVEVEND